MTGSSPPPTVIVLPRCVDGPIMAFVLVALIHQGAWLEDLLQGGLYSSPTFICGILQDLTESAAREGA